METVDHVTPVLAQHREAHWYNPDAGHIPQCSCGTFGLPAADSAAEQAWHDAHVAGLLVDVLRAADLLWEPSPPRCEEEHLRPGGAPRDNWDWLKCMHELGHAGDHEDDESGFHWPQSLPSAG